LLGRRSGDAVSLFVGSFSLEPTHSTCWVYSGPSLAGWLLRYWEWAVMGLREMTKVTLVSLALCTLMLGPRAWPAPQAITTLPLEDKRAEAKALVDARQLDSAEKMIVGEMMTAPRNADWITLLAEVRLGQNRTGEALKLLDSANQIDGFTATRWMLISLAESQAGHMDRAEQPIRNAIRLSPDDATAHYFLARLLYTDNRFNEAIEESQKVVSLAPNFVRAYENLGLCYEGKYQLEEAKRSYLKAIAVDATSNKKTEWPALDLATLLIHQNQLAEAKPYLVQALQINPNNTQALIQMGTLLERAGDLKGALDKYRAAIGSEHSNLQPGLASAYYKAAQICKKLGYTDEATKDLNKFREVHDKH
jgi:tetratricopeptide (TPR) repeat protein